MAVNPYVNKVEVNGNTIIDLTADTVDASHLAQGYTAHDCSGAIITGTMVDNSGYPIEVSTAAGMSAVLLLENECKAYKYTGDTTSEYTNGDIYIVEVEI